MSQLLGPTFPSPQSSPSSLQLSIEPIPPVESSSEPIVGLLQAPSPTTRPAAAAAASAPAALAQPKHDAIVGDPSASLKPPPDTLSTMAKPKASKRIRLKAPPAVILSKPPTAPTMASKRSHDTLNEPSKKEGLFKYDPLKDDPFYAAKPAATASAKLATVKPAEPATLSSLMRHAMLGREEAPDIGKPLLMEGEDVWNFEEEEEEEDYEDL